MNVANYAQQVISDRVIAILLGQMLDANNADEVVQTIIEAQARGVKFVIIDFEKLEFLSSAGVGAIIGTIDSFRDIGGDIVLCNVSETTCHVLRVLDLLNFLTIVRTRQEAIAFCEQSLVRV